MSAVINSIAATVVGRSSWGRALRLRATWLRHHPDRELHFLALEEPPPGLALPADLPLTRVEELELPDFPACAMRFQASELVARVKPRFLLRLLERFEKVVCVDAHFVVCGSLNPVFDLLDRAPLVLTPRFLQPFPEACPEPELEALRSGHFHPGVIAVGRTGADFLRWLDARCRELAFDEPAHGLGRDSKWLNLAPAIFPGVHIERSPSQLVGPWNLHERELCFRDGAWRVNDGAPLRILDVEGLDLVQRPDLEPLLEAAGAGHPIEPSVCPSRFERFEDGTPVTALARRIFAISALAESSEDPFAADSEFLSFCRKHHLVEDAPPSSAVSDPQGPAAGLVRAAFSWFLRCFGGVRYELLLKYLRFLSSARNQQELFFAQRKPEKTGLDPEVFERVSAPPGRKVFGGFRDSGFEAKAQKTVGRVRNP
jgi:hypothetical protein